MQAFIISLGKFLPGGPIDNHSMEKYLGKINGKASRVRQRILNQNGIQTRHYAIDDQQKTLISNAGMAAHFHIGTEILQFVATNVPGVGIPLNPCGPGTLRD